MADIDHEAAKITASAMKHPQADGPFSNLAACYLDSQAKLEAERKISATRIVDLLKRATAAEQRLHEVEAWLSAMQENRDSWLRKHDRFLPVLEICERLQAQVNWTLDGDGIGNELARALTALAPERTESGPCPLGDNCPDAHKYGDIHPAPASPLLPGLEWCFNECSDNEDAADDAGNKQAAKAHALDAEIIRAEISRLKGEGRGS